MMYNDIPDSENVVYFIRSSDYVKIGIAAQLKTRLKTINTDCPDGATLLGYIRSDFNRDLEKCLHNVFNVWHKRGEWFFASGQLLREIYSLHGFIPWADEAKEFLENKNFDIAQSIVECVKREEA